MKLQTCVIIIYRGLCAKPSLVNPLATARAGVPNPLPIRIPWSISLRSSLLEGTLAGLKTPSGAMETRRNVAVECTPAHTRSTSPGPENQPCPT